MILDSADKKCKDLNKCGLNNHWKPFISLCSYCDIPYRVIVKAETIKEDQKNLGLMANVTFPEIGLVFSKRIAKLKAFVFQNLIRVVVEAQSILPKSTFQSWMWLWSKNFMRFTKWTLKCLNTAQTSTLKLPKGLLEHNLQVSP